jgi:hypothetical protein
MRSPTISPLNVSLAEPLGKPLWLAREPHRFLQHPETYYRCIVPARAVGGQVRAWLRLSIDGGEPVTVNLFDHSPHARHGPEWLNANGRPARHVTVYGLGQPTIIGMPGIPVQPVVAELIAGIVAAGGTVLIESDDDWLAMADVRVEHMLTYRDTRVPGWRTRPDAARRLTAIHEQAFEMGRLVQQAVPRTLAAASGLVLATEPIATAWSQYNPRTTVIANAYDPRDFTTSTVVDRPDDGVVRIGYGGDWHHWAVDVADVLPALLGLARRPDVELVFLGHHPRITEGADYRAGGRYTLDGAPYTFVPYIDDLFAYQQALRMFDVAVAPLADLPFNRGRSGTKWVEHALHETACVLPAMEPYAAAEDGVTALKFPPGDADALARQLTRLIDDAALRHRIGRAAREEVERNHTIAARASAWRAVVEGSRSQGQQQPGIGGSTLVG